MDFSWSEEQRKLQIAVAEFAQANLNHGLDERDRNSDFNSEGWRQCAEMGIQGLNVPEQYGGLGQDVLTTVGVLEQLGYGCRDNGLCFSLGAHMWTAQMPLLSFGTPEQKEKYLPRLVSGELIGGNAMSEPDSGSDAYALRTTASKQRDVYVLSGNKVFVTNGPVAGLLVVFATVDPKRGKTGVSAFLVESDTPGLNITRKMEKMGLNTSPMAELHFENCEVPAENLLGSEGAGQALFADSMMWERSCILATAIGTMQRLFEQSIEYSKTRKQFGQRIIDFQLIGSKLVDMKLRLESARSQLYQTAWKRSLGRSIFLEAALTKLVISENWVQLAQDALQIHGGYGYMKELGLEREVRDAIGSRLYSGTSEIQRVISASLIG